MGEDMSGCFNKAILPPRLLACRRDELSNVVVLWLENSHRLQNAVCAPVKLPRVPQAGRSGWWATTKLLWHSPRGTDTR